ncbi:MAG: 2-hydroxyacid dehydrogenase [Nocardioidaceae bacterium]|jgi:phosphoglycerate dehydrogenase-like enzyme|nr:2-hydroxyacid dehydrogenase [Nocardioidaceae bacterium]
MAAPHLVWLPFAAEDLGDPPDGLQIETYEGGEPPGSVERVEFFVPSYDIGLDVSVLLPRMRNLRVVQTQTAGVDNVEPYVPAGVTLCNARGVHDASTAELAMGLVLASLRGIPDFALAQTDGRWLHGVRPALADRSVLIVGYGSIGAALERRLDGFECEIVRVARRARDGVHGWQDLPGLLGSADVVVLMVPLDDSTRRLVDDGFLARMKDGALLVNVARGGVVDTEALVAECATGRLTAAVDVTDPEPLPPEHPLWTTPGVLVSPHVGGATSAMKPRVTRLVEEQLVRFAAGTPLANVVGAGRS